MAKTRDHIPRCKNGDGKPVYANGLCWTCHTSPEVRQELRKQIHRVTKRKK